VLGGNRKKGGARISGRGGVNAETSAKIIALSNQQETRDKEGMWQKRGKPKDSTDLSLKKELERKMGGLQDRASEWGRSRYSLHLSGQTVLQKSGFSKGRRRQKGTKNCTY